LSASRKRAAGSRRPAARPGSSRELVSAARQARRRARADYSGFKVGAALEAADGTVITGCNIENATYGLTMCAERVAMFKAISEGHRMPTPPCGSCRQILWEFAGDIDVVLANTRRITSTRKMSELLPQPFDRSFL
jgi:cytidine deaminase